MFHEPINTAVVAGATACYDFIKTYGSGGGPQDEPGDSGTSDQGPQASTSNRHGKNKEVLSGTNVTPMNTKDLPD